MRRSSLIYAALFFGIASAAYAAERPLWNEIIQLEPGQYAYLPVNVPVPLVNGRIAGSFQAAGGAGNEITFTILSADAFKSYANGRGYTPDYTAERRRSNVVSVPIRKTGTYYLVFDNRFSLLARKQVRVDLRIVYDAEDRRLAAELAKKEQERLQRIGAILGKLTETLQARERALGTHQINPPIRFGIIEDTSINAFAQPERQIVALSRGLISFAEGVGTPELTDAILAGVLGHELAHIFYRHTSGNIQAQGVQAVGIGGAAAYTIHPLVGLIAGALVLDQQRAYDRMEEREADMLGIQLACEAGFDPTGILMLMQRLSHETSTIDFLQTHPSPQSREEYLRSEAASCLRPQAPPLERVSGMKEPVLLYQVQPSSTAEARRAGIRGIVEVRATVGTDGRAHDLQITKGLGFGLDEAAIQTIETFWRFRPGEKDGAPISSIIQIKITFQ